MNKMYVSALPVRNILFCTNLFRSYQRNETFQKIKKTFTLKKLLMKNKLRKLSLIIASILLAYYIHIFMQALALLEFTPSI